MTKKSLVLGGIGALGAIGVAGGGVYLYLRGQLPWQKFDALEAARVVPRDAFATGFISTDSADWQALGKFGTPESRQVFERGFQEFNKGTIGDNIKFSEDILPWLGGATFAILPTPKGENGVLLVLGVKDKLKANDFANKLKSSPGRTTTESDYKGIKIAATTSPPDDVTYSARAGDYLLISNDRTLVEAGIDTHQGRPSYLDKPEFQQLRQQALNLQDPVIKIYIDNYAKMVGGGTDLTPEMTQQLNKVKGVAAGMGFTDKGIYLQAVTKLADNTLANLPTPGDAAVLENFPADTLAVVSGNNIKGTWAEFENQSKNNPLLEQVLSQLRSTFQMATLDADRDVFSWMDGEFAMGMVPNDRAIGGAGFGGLIVLETGDRKTAENTLTKIEGLRKFAPEIAIKTNKINDRPVTEWNVQQQTFLTYGWLNDNSLGMTIGMPSLPNPTDNLTRNPVFQETVSSLPKNNLGYFYLDMKGMVSKFNLAGLPPTEMNPDFLAVLNSIKGVAMTIVMPDKNTSQADMLINLERTP